jgi:hypothetical protein
MVFAIALLSATLWNSYQAQHSPLGQRLEDKEIPSSVIARNGAFPALNTNRFRPVYQVTRFKAPAYNYRVGLNHPLDAELGDIVALASEHPQEAFNTDTLFD